MKYSLNDVIYGGSLHYRLWENNPNATVPNCIPNCTTLAYGLCDIKPVSKIVNASNWHNYLINGWTVQKFDRSKVKQGDIIEWVKGVHVAYVDLVNEDGIFLHSSWYTGDHGVAIWDGNFDTRSFSTLKQVSDFMSANYPTRMYHYWDLDREIKGIGSEPEYLLVAPSSERIYPVEENPNVDQIHVLTDVQNVRDNDNHIVGIAEHGYYNVLQKKLSHGYVWYEVYPNKYIAGVDGRVEFIEASDEISKLKKEIAQLKKENAILRDRLIQIHSLSEV